MRRRVAQWHIVPARRATTTALGPRPAQGLRSLQTETAFLLTSGSRLQALRADAPPPAFPGFTKGPGYEYPMAVVTEDGTETDGPRAGGGGNCKLVYSITPGSSGKAVTSGILEVSTRRGLARDARAAALDI